MRRSARCLYLYLCSVLKLLLQQLAHLAELRGGLPARLQFARPGHAVTLALLPHVADHRLQHAHTQTDTDRQTDTHTHKDTKTERQRQRQRQTQREKRKTKLSVPICVVFTEIYNYIGSCDNRGIYVRREKFYIACTVARTVT